MDFYHLRIISGGRLTSILIDIYTDQTSHGCPIMLETWDFREMFCSPLHTFSLFLSSSGTAHSLQFHCCVPTPIELSLICESILVDCLCLSASAWMLDSRISLAAKYSRLFTPAVSSSNVADQCVRPLRTTSWCIKTTFRMISMVKSPVKTWSA